MKSQSKIPPKRSSISASSKRRSASPASRKKNTSPEYPTLTQIKAKLPSHCFKADVSLSIYYMIRDVVLSAALLLAMRWLWQNQEIDAIVSVVLYPFYAFALGTLMWGIFVLGHDCGHGSFSPSATLNFVCGCFLHSLILVPYYPWKLTHHHHHKNTGNIDNDEVFHPVRSSLLEASTLYKPLAFMQKTLAAPVLWFWYLTFGYSPKHHLFYHFWPFYQKFARHYKQVLLSHVGLAAAAYGIYRWSEYDSIQDIIFLYFIPLVIFGMWLVVTTFLHHNEPNSVKWYAGEKWNYVKGNLSSVDRVYGPILDNLTHHIGTHQVHHLFPIIPHYHLVEVRLLPGLIYAQATKSFRKEFPQFVSTSDKPILTAFADSMSNFTQRGTVGDDVDEFVL